MATLTFDSSVPHKWRRTFGRLFELITGRLGIADSTARVSLSLKYIEGDGEIGPAVSPANIERLRRNAHPVEYELNLNAYSIRTGRRMAAVLAHELIHLKQWVTDELGWRLGPTGLESTYMKIVTDKRALPYKESPWEKEAFGRMYELGDWALRKVKEEREQRRKAAEYDQ